MRCCLYEHTMMSYAHGVINQNYNNGKIHEFIWDSTTMNLQKLNPTVIRQYLVQAKKFLATVKSDVVFRRDVYNLGILHPNERDWEIENMKRTGMIIISQIAEETTEEQKNEIETY